MGFEFKKAEKAKSKLRLAVIGPSGAGKTWTALAIASGLGTRIAVIDTERGSASLYADKFDFDVLELDSYAPGTYADAIRAAVKEGYEVVIVDSLSHAWSGKDGALERVDNIAKKSRSGSSFTAWRDVTPQHNHMVDTIISAPAHIIVTMRAKTEYVQEKDDKGRTVIRKVGLQPIQREGLEYEFTVVGDIDIDHNMVVSKTRCSELTDKVFYKPGAEFAGVLKDWLASGAPEKATKPAPGPKETAFGKAGHGLGDHEMKETTAKMEPPADDDAPSLFDATKDRIAACNDSGELATIRGDLKAIQSGKMVERSEMEALVKLYNEAKARLESAE